MEVFRQTPKVLIIGKPNVGKSTLFNRLLKKKKAAVSEKPFCTKDYLSDILKIEDKECELIDTGGIIQDLKDDIHKLIKKNVLELIRVSDIVLLICQRDNLTADDFWLAEILRKFSKKIILCVNKVDNMKVEQDVTNEFYRLGLGEPICLSAIHNLNIESLKEKIANLLDKSEEKEDIDSYIKVAIVGKPNVGKSTLANAILNKERLITSEKPFTTTDAVDIPFEFSGKKLLLIDTPGIRKWRKLKDIQSFSVIQSYKTISKADIVIFVLDITTNLGRTDKRIFNYIWKDGKALVFCLNKFDLAKFPKSDYVNFIFNDLRLSFNPPFCFTSGIRKEGIENLLKKMINLKNNLNLNFKKEELNRIKSGIFSITSGKKTVEVLRIEHIKENIFFVKTKPKTLSSSLFSLLKKNIERRLRLPFPIKIIGPNLKKK